MGLALQDQGKLKMAMKAFKKAVSLKPDFADAYNNLGKLHWLQQEFIQAFDLMEWRWQKKYFSIGFRLNSTHPTWNGEDRSKVFVWKEQGIGDEIMFSSLLIDANTRSEELVIECDKRLIPLYKRSFPKNIKFVDDRDKVSATLYDAQIAIGSLPKHFRHKLSDFTMASAGWLKSDPQKTSTLRKKLISPQNNKIIGISWFTKSSDARYQSRNIPINLLAKYLKQIPAKYVNLQYGETAEELSEIYSTFGLEVAQVDGLDLLNDIEGLAALVSACDIVVSIDNATVHLAGALGIDTRALLPFSPNDRWSLDQSTSYWYESVTLYRQEVGGNWNKPLEDLLAELAQISF
jgi:tetratricopeptide (TPR) repeat protein